MTPFVYQPNSRTCLSSVHKAGSFLLLESLKPSPLQSQSLCHSPDQTSSGTWYGPRLWSPLCLPANLRSSEPMSCRFGPVCLLAGAGGQYLQEVSNARLPVVSRLQPVPHSPAPLFPSWSCPESRQTEEWGWHGSSWLLPGFRGGITGWVLIPHKLQPKHDIKRCPWR